MSSESQQRDRHEIHELTLRYARSVDRRDYAAFAEIFAVDGWLAVHPGPDLEADPQHRMEGVEAIQAAMQGIERYDRTFHLLGNHSVCFEDDGNAARGETYCTAHHIHRLDGVWTDTTMFIRYRDRFVRTADGWRIAQRQLGLDFRRITALGDEPPLQTSRAPDAQAAPRTRGGVQR